MGHPIKDDSFSMLVSGQLYTERKAAGEAIIAACKTMTDPNQKINLGEYRGFPMTLSLSGQTFQVSMKKNLSYTAEIANDPSGNITRINHVLEKIPDHLKTQQERLLTLQSELEQAKEEVKRPFSKEEELMQKSERLIQLNKELDLDEKQTDKAPQEEKEKGLPFSRHSNSLKRRQSQHRKNRTRRWYDEAKGRTDNRTLYQGVTGRKGTDCKEDGAFGHKKPARILKKNGSWMGM